MTFSDLTSTLRSWRRWKNPTRVREEIEEEIRFHIDERTDALVASGMSRDAAREQARALFGDVDRMTLDCLTIQMGQRAQLQKMQWVLIGALALGLVLLGWVYNNEVGLQRDIAQRLHAEAEMHLLRAQESQAMARAHAQEIAQLRSLANQQPQGIEPHPVPQSAQMSAALWLARFEERPDDWRHLAATANALMAELAPEQAMPIMTAIWANLSDVAKQQVLKAVAFTRGHSGMLAMMHLGATDAAPEVQIWALSYLRDYAFRSFSEDFPDYIEWYGRWRDSELADVLKGNAREFIARLQGRSVSDVADELRDFKRLDLRVGERVDVDLAQVLSAAGAHGLIEDWLASGDKDAIERAYSWAAVLGMDEVWLRAHVIPVLHDDDPASIAAAIRVLDQPVHGWAVPELLDYLERSVLVAAGATPARSGVWAAAGALAQIGDASVIPAMIGLISANPCYDTIYGIGYFGLGKMTGVSYDESHDGVWWREWWRVNQVRFAEDVRAIPVPDYSAPR